MQATSKPLALVAAWLYVLTTLLLAAFPLGLLWALVFPQHWQDARLVDYADTPQPDVLSLASLLGLGLVDLAGSALTIVILWQIRNLLRLYKTGTILHAENARYILRIGQGLVALSVFGLLAQTLDVLAITSGNPPGLRQLQIAVSDAELGLALAGGLMILIGWAMQQAATLADDHAAII